MHSFWIGLLSIIVSAVLFVCKKVGLGHFVTSLMLNITCAYLACWILIKIA